MKKRAKELGIKVDGRWSNARIQQEIDKVENASIEGADVIELEAETALDEAKLGDVKPVDKFQTLEWANERAAAMWHGQSEDLSMIERVGRIRMALKEKGFKDFDNLVIPTEEEYKRYL